MESLVQVRENNIVKITQAHKVIQVAVAYGSNKRRYLTYNVSTERLPQMSVAYLSFLIWQVPDGSEICFQWPTTVIATTSTVPDNGQ